MAEIDTSPDKEEGKGAFTLVRLIGHVNFVVVQKNLSTSFIFIIVVFFFFFFFFLVNFLPKEVL